MLSYLGLYNWLIILNYHLAYPHKYFHKTNEHTHACTPYSISRGSTQGGIWTDSSLTKC